MLYSVRKASLDDLPAMMEIGHEGLRPHIEALRGWDSVREEQGFREHFDPSYIEIIQVGVEDAGYIKLETHSDHVYIDGIYIGRGFRSKGLGTQMLSDRMQDFSDSGLPLRLRVLRTNPAKGLYEHLGFKVIDHSDDAFVLEYRNAP